MKHDSQILQTSDDRQNIGGIVRLLVVTENRRLEQIHHRGLLDGCCCQLLLEFFEAPLPIIVILIQ